MGIAQASLVVDSLNALNQAVQDTLETLSFSEALPVPQESYPPLHLPVYVTTVEVHRPYTGFIRLIIPRNMAISLVGSMLGSTGNLEEEWVQDGLSELVNIIGGRILAHLVDSFNSFDLSIPQTVCLDKELPSCDGILVRQAYVLNDEHVELELEFQKARAA
ncbi:MAG TPA: chemotaxis protein CheX [Oligoflexus sp.]|uniref:chemotaxis protein CheX n=1 Tax=Oligoflexus sp. TaxID=1971216 RepID=UPI002D2D27FB|nr:chemotaxis protein CheX [Oligoflexus sp.]HYX33157.1 chemotaxis protein CheX [Oligoflexus sp.]